MENGPRSYSKSITMLGYHCLVTTNINIGSRVLGIEGKEGKDNNHIRITDQ